MEKGFETPLPSLKILLGHRKGDAIPFSLFHKRQRVVFYSDFDDVAFLEFSV
jgi:hypothetical protein